jgi:hypothetical protein
MKAAPEDRQPLRSDPTACSAAIEASDAAPSFEARPGIGRVHARQHVADVATERRRPIGLSFEQQMRQRPRFGVEHSAPRVLVVLRRRLRRGEQSVERQPRLAGEPLQMIVDRLSDRDRAAAALDPERAEVLGQPLIEPERHAGRQIVDHQVRILMKHGGEIVARTRRSDEDVVHLRPAREQAADVDLLAAVDRLERRKRSVIWKLDDDCWDGARRGGRRQPARERFAEGLELRANVGQPSLAFRTHDHDIRRVDADPARLGGCPPRVHRDRKQGGGDRRRAPRTAADDRVHHGRNSYFGSVLSRAPGIGDGTSPAWRAPRRS